MKSVTIIIVPTHPNRIMREDLHTEFKSAWKDGYLRDIAAFANTEGGILCIGVDDGGEVIGVSNPDRLLKSLPDKIQNALGIVPAVDYREKDGVPYVTVRVEPGPDPVFLDGKIFVRSGSTTRELKGGELRNYIASHSDAAWADNPSGIDPVLLDTYAFREFKETARRMGRLTEEECDLPMMDLLDKLNLVSKGRPTRAAAIMFSTDPTETSHGAMMRICRISDSEILFSDELKVPMFLAVDMMVNLIMTKYAVAPVTYEGIIRVENHPYPRDAVREALINAVSNTDYGSGYSIKINVLDDRMIIQNSGGLPYGMDLEYIISKFVSRPRNKGIAAVFRAAGMSETFGRGFEKMRKPYRESGVTLPEFDALPNDFIVVFRNIVAEKGIVPRDMNGKAVVPEHADPAYTEGLTENEKNVLLLIANGEFDTSKNVANKLNISDVTVRRALASLSEKGKIHREGSKKTGKWILI